MQNSSLFAAILSIPPQKKSPPFSVFCLSFWDSSRMTPFQIWVIWGPNPPEKVHGKNSSLWPTCCRCFLIWIWMLQKLVAPWNGHLVRSCGFGWETKWGGWDWLVGWLFRVEVWVDFFLGGSFLVFVFVLVKWILLPWYCWRSKSRPSTSHRDFWVDCKIQNQKRPNFCWWLSSLEGSRI